jgi:thioredoxin-related protein
MRFLVLLLLGLLSMAGLNAQSPAFLKALEKAKKEDKLVMVDFYTDWCYWCKVLEKKTFSDPVIKEKIKERFILIRLNAEKQDGIELAKRYGIHSYPLCMFINPDKRVVSMVAGYAKPDYYETLLDSVWKLKLAGKTLHYSPTFSLQFPDFYNSMFQLDRSKISWPKPSETESYLSDSNNWNTEVGYIVIHKLYNQNYKKHLLKSAKYCRQWKLNYGDPYASQTFNVQLSAFIDSNLNMRREAMYDTLYGYCMIANASDSVAAKNQTFNFMSSYLSGSKQWLAFAQWLDNDYRKNKSNYTNSYLNQAAWDIYKDTRDTAALNIAIHWMSDVVKSDDEYNHADTYAALLYALKRYDEAETAAKEAIELAKKSGENYAETKKLLGRIYTER